MIDYRIRRGTLADGPAIAAMFARIRALKLPYLPILHTAEEDVAFFGGHVMAACTVWVAETDSVVGFIAWGGSEVHHLYLDVGYLGQGIGSALLRLAMDEQPHLELWAFQKNTDAIGFYRARGFRVIRETDGSGNQEKEPDVRLAWDRPYSSP